MLNYHTLRPLIFKLSPEMAHEASMLALKLRLPPSPSLQVRPELAMKVMGLDWPSPVGMAPGYDKNAEVMIPLFRQGFGFVEAGTVTPQPQQGNPKPRLFRLTDDQAIINRMGFNNKGLDYYLKGLKRTYAAYQQGKIHGLVGANIGRNKTSPNDASDYSTGMEAVYPYCHYITINISSPNTPGLRGIHEKSTLTAFLTPLINKQKMLQDHHQIHRPLLLKLSPDLGQDHYREVLDVIAASAIDGLVIANTTLSREGLQSRQRDEAGGMSGKPLHGRSCNAIRTAYQHLGRRLPIIGVGGIHSAESAYETLRAGASLVQLYSALIYQGFGLVRHIHEGLLDLLVRDRLPHIQSAIGRDRGL